MLSAKVIPVWLFRFSWDLNVSHAHPAHQPIIRRLTGITNIFFPEKETRWVVGKDNSCLDIFVLMTSQQGFFFFFFFFKSLTYICCHVICATVQISIMHNALFSPMCLPFWFLVNNSHNNQFHWRPHPTLYRSDILPLWDNRDVLDEDEACSSKTEQHTYGFIITGWSIIMQPGCCLNVRWAATYSTDGNNSCIDPRFWTISDSAGQTILLSFSASEPRRNLKFTQWI